MTAFEFWKNLTEDPNSQRLDSEVQQSKCSTYRDLIWLSLNQIVKVQLTRKVSNNAEVVSPEGSILVVS